MKKKRKGFTLTELIAVIVILAVLGLIGIPSYNSLRRQTLETQYENVVGLIETEASKYAAKKSVSITNVQELIDEGLIETDDGSNVIDPRNKESMNCKLIEITYENGTYTSKMIETEECDLEEARRDYSKIRILVEGKESGREITGNSWIGEDVKISVVATNLPIEDEIIGYRWISGTGQTSNESTMESNVATILDTTVNVEVTSSSNHKYFANVVLKIDKEKPLIKSVEQSGGNDWTKGRDVIITATDQNGSGMSGYYVGTTPCDGTTTFKTVDDPKGEVNIESILIYETTEYHVCVKDAVGNITEYPETILLQVEDQNAPTCVWGGENTDWTKDTVEITLTCKDNESGCHPNYRSYSETFDETTKTTTLSYTIKDNAGNSTTCTKEVNVYVDKTAPEPPTTMNFVYGDWSVYTDGTNSPWTKNNIYAGRTSSSRGPIGATDAESGVAKYQISSDGRSWEDFNYDYTKPMYKMSGSGIHTRYFRAVDNVGNVSSSISRTARIDQTAPTCGTATNASTTWTKSNRTIKQACTETSGSGCAKTSYDTTYSSGTTTTGSVTISDNVGNTRSCSYNVYVDKTAPTCGTATNASTTWTKSSRTIKQACTETSGSGCAKSSYDTTYSSGTTKTSSVTISDNVGNTRSCSYNVYVDKTAPTCGTATNASTTWTKDSRTIKQACTETSGSGCAKSSYDTTYSSGTTKTSSVTISDNVGNTRSCSYNVYVDKTAPTCGTATNASTTWTKSSRTIKQACTETSGSGCAKSSYDTTYSSGTTKTSSVTISDNVGNTRSCTYNVYVDKSGPTITYGTDGSGYVTQASTTVSASDGGSGLKSIKYGWSTSSSSTTANTAVSSGSSVSSTCSYSNAGGNCYLYTYACDNLGNCNSKRSNFLIDRQKPTITHVSTWFDSNAVANCWSGSKVCAKFLANDPQTTNLNELYFVRTHCWERNSNTDYQSCTYKGVDMSAVKRRDYFVANNDNYLTFDMRRIVANTLNNNLDNKTANTSLYTIASDGTFYVATSASSSLTVQYAFRVCDRRMNCADANFKSK